jgi:hypothetical protein
MPLDQVLRYAIEIADALDKAHRKGVTHRDLKPGNIMLTKTGTKLLDFGLAKLKQEAAPSNVPLSDLPTAKDPLTAQGAIVGTLQYMAPEQLEGKDADARTDIFAFGAVVYEMATRKRAFEGTSQASVISAIMSSDPPPMSSLQPMTPPALDRTIKTCLAKDADSRWQSASDLERELKWVAESGPHASSSVPTTATKGFYALGPRATILSVGALFLVAAITGLGTWNLKPSPTRPVIRTMINLPPGQQLAGLDSGPVLALSPDGAHLGYVARQGGTQQLYLRAMDSIDAKPIPGTEGAVNPFFSPDSQWIGFFAGGKLKKVSVKGGAALTIGDAVYPGGASWGDQGMIAFSPTGVGVLQQVPDAGGTPQPLTRFEKGEASHRWPEFLPGAKAVLFASGGAISSQKIAVHVLGNDDRRDLIQGGTSPHYASSGHLVYAQAGTLMAMPFDRQRFALTGSAIPAVEGVAQSTINVVAQYSFSATGTLVYVSGGVQSAQLRLVWVSRDGAEQPVAAPAHA